MKISYITMQFPVPSETFASLDVEVLRSQGLEVSVYGMRPEHIQFKKLMKERGHTDLPVGHFSLSSIVTFMFFLFQHPLISFSFIKWVVSCCFRTPKHLLKSIALLPSAVSIFSSISKEKPDVVHLFWGHYPSMVGYLVKKHMPNTVVSMFLGAHDLVATYPGSVQFSRDADLMFTHSKSNLPMISDMGIDVGKVNIVVRGTRLDFPVEGVVNKFEQLAAPAFLTAGRLIEEKGVDDVLRIFQRVLMDYPNATLHVAGDGPFKMNLEKMAVSLGLGKKTMFLGHVEHSELINKMSNSHFFILMSRYPSERLPNVIKEAMYQECVVVTTKTSGIDELVHNGVEGFIVEQGDYRSALAYINSCLANQEKSQTIAVSAKKKIKDKFDVNVSMRSYILLWRSALEERGLL